MMRRILFAIGIALLPFVCRAQIVTTQPVFPVADQAVVVIFDATMGNGGLRDYTDGDVYAHTGVITNLSANSSDWRYAPTWLDNDSKYRLVSLGNNLWQFTITPSIREFYGVPEGETILQLAFVFRNANGTREGKDTGNADIFVTVYAEGLNVSFSTPDADRLIERGTLLPIEINASAPASLRLYLDDNLLQSGENVTSLSTGYLFEEAGSFWLIAEAGNASGTLRDSLLITVRAEVVTEPMPAGLRPGIRLLDQTTAAFVLYAPSKEYVYLIGDFGDWRVFNDFALKRDGDYWWIVLDGLTPGQEYAFQYLVDGVLRIADPYADKILDEYNDPYIPEAVYPGLKPYPRGKTQGIVSVVQTGQEEYAWETPDFTFSYPDNKLVIYELLVRDFTEQHSFDAIVDKLDYLETLGVNVIELMPVNEFEGNISWGYNPSFYFAVDKYYGTKTAFKRLVDACHQRGMAVVMDLVLNHAYGQSPFVQLYWDSANNRPAANSPWFNVTSPNPTYSWGYDFNHESLQTQALVDSVNSYWMQEYKIDGFRFDFTKGFTNTPGDGWAYDQSRVDILKRMASEIRKRNPGALIIFEHLADNSEETTLSNDNILLWGNMNNNYGEAHMGWTANSDLSGGLYSRRGWTRSTLVAYMESHDEERTTYKAITWGNASGAYNVKNLATALERAELITCFYLPLPGPKMIWQFGELGYDYSIGTCEDLSVSDACRTDPKPIRWDFFDEPGRRAVYDVYSKLTSVKKQAPLFESTDVSYSLTGAVKHFVWRAGAGNNAFVVGNFDVVNQPVVVAIPASGTWYDLFTGEESTLSTTYTADLAPGEYRFYVDNRDLAGPTSSIPSVTGSSRRQIVFYSGAEQSIRIETPEPVSAVGLYNAQGALLGLYPQATTINMRGLPEGLYVVRVKTAEDTLNVKIAKY